MDSDYNCNSVIKETNFYLTDDEDLSSSLSTLCLPESREFAQRIRRTLYYGRLPSEDRPSLPMTDLAVGFLRDAAPKEFGKIDMYWAAEVSRKAYISPCSLMLGMIYIERLKHKNPDYLTQVSSSDLFLISMMVASKYLYDEGVDEEVFNDEWAESAALETTDVNTMERHFLNAIDWSLFTKHEDFQRLFKSVEENITCREGLNRGCDWTYSDLTVLLGNCQLQTTLCHFMEDLCKVMVVCTLAYTAGTMVLLGSISTLSMLQQAGVPLVGPVTLETAICSHPGATVLEEQPIVDFSSRLVESNLTDNDNIAELFENESESSHRNESETTFESETTVPRSLSVSGFLTLAFIKDTLTQFLIAAVNGNTPCCTYDNNDNSVAATRECSCKNCPMRSQYRSKRERKMQFAEQNFLGNDYVNMKHLSKPIVRSNGPSGKSDFSMDGCNTEKDLRCGNGYGNQNQEFVEEKCSDVRCELDERAMLHDVNCRGNEEAFNRRSETCQYVEKSSPFLQTLRCKIQPLFVDLVSRFETSSFQVAMAG